MRLKQFADWLLRFPSLWILLIIAITFGLGYYGQFVKQEYSVELFIPEGEPELDYFSWFKDEFEPDDNIIFIGLKRDDLWTNPNIWQDIDKLSMQFGEIDGVTDVISLTTYQTIRGEAGELIIESLVENFPETTEDLAEIRKTVMSDSLLFNFLISPNGKATAFYLKIDPEKQNYNFRDAVLKTLRSTTDNYPQYHFHFGGIPHIRNKFIELLKDEQNRSIAISSLVLILILFWTFRNIRGVILPLSVIGMSVIWTVGVMGLFNTDFDLLSSVMPTIIMVVGLSDSIHLMFKYYEERNLGKNRKDAFRETIEKLGAATLMTSVTTAIGFGVLYSANMKPMKNFGTYTAVGVIFAFIISIVFLMLVMMYLKPPRKNPNKKNTITFFEKWVMHASRMVKTKPNRILLISGAIIIFMAFGIPRININNYVLDEIPEAEQVMKDFRFFEKEFGGIVTFEVIVDAGEDGAAKTPEMLKTIDEIVVYLKTVPEIGTVISPTMVIKNLNQTMHDGDAAFYKIPDNRELIAQYLFLASLSGKDPLENYINHSESTARITAKLPDVGSKRTDEILNDFEIFAEKNVPESYTVRTTGTVKLVRVVNDQITFNLANTLILAFVIISILMGILFRSIRWALISIIPNIVPLLIVAGIMGWLGIRLRPPTAIVFSVAFGIAVDDTIHFLSRLKIEIDEGFGLTDAIHQSLIHTGKAIISTSLVLIAGLASLLFSDFHSTFDFGLLSCITLSAALLADLYLLPVLIERFV